MTPIQEIDVDLIDPHPQNPRRELGNLTELANSIKAQGIRQNLLLVPNGDRYTVVIGHRRLAAAKKAKLATVPAVATELSDQEQLELMLLENIQRSDLTVIEEAEGYQGLLDLGVNYSAISKATGRNVKTVQTRVKLLGLPDAAREKVHGRQATLEEAAKLAEFLAGGNVDDRTLTRLSESLGTSNFSWYLGDAKRERDRTQKQDVLVAAATQLGATELDARDPDDEQVTDANYTERTVSSVEDLGELPAGTRFERTRYGEGIRIFTPDPDGAIRTAEEAAAQAAREAAAERARQDHADREMAKQLREAFVSEYVTRTKIPPAHTEAILSAAAPRIFTGNLWLHSASKSWDPSTWKPVCCLLVMLLVECQHSFFDNPRLQELYALLTKLGYAPSEVETERLTAAREA